jgi:hypothetical protein
MAQRGVLQGEAHHDSIQQSTGDPWLDLLACSHAVLFQAAEGHGLEALAARAQIQEIYTEHSLSRLRRAGLISW